MNHVSKPGSRYPYSLTAEKILAKLLSPTCNKELDSPFIEMTSNPDWRVADEQTLIKYAQDGDAEAFAEIYARYAPSIYRFLNANMDDPMEAEDLLADVFFRIWQALPGYKEQGTPFLVLLYRIARNRLIDHYRKAANKRQHTSIDLLNLPDQRPEPVDLVIANLEYAELRQIIKGMREDYRTVLVLRFVNGLTPEETALVMNRSVGAVRVLQHRALAVLRKLLDRS